MWNNMEHSGTAWNLVEQYATESFMLYEASNKKITLQYIIYNVFFVANDSGFHYLVYTCVYTNFDMKSAPSI